MDRNTQRRDFKRLGLLSLSARRAWIEICGGAFGRPLEAWSLSARRAWIEMETTGEAGLPLIVALRKESVDRNGHHCNDRSNFRVALRKESVDRNSSGAGVTALPRGSLSARRAWIEIIMTV